MTVQYSHGGLSMLQMTGSVFPNACKPAFVAAILAALFNLMMYTWHVPEFLSDMRGEGFVFQDNSAWTAFTSLVGFLIVFRTSQAYSRFWDGCTACHMMRAEWFDACSSLIAFCKHSKKDEEDILVFQNTLVRLFSMLHALALAEIEDLHEEEDKAAFTYELLDVQAIDKPSLMAIKESDCKVELVFQWIQQLVVENIDSGVLSIPPPILSRAFQELATGMVQFHDAAKISSIPFPFPYAQCCDCFLVLHSLMTPFVMSQLVDKPWWAFILSFVQVFVLWSLNYISLEIQNPFGGDPNDLDSREMQQMMNKQLVLLMNPKTLRTPRIGQKSRNRSSIIAEYEPGAQKPKEERKSFASVWYTEEQLGEPTRLSQRFSIGSATGSIGEQKNSDGTEDGTDPPGGDIEPMSGGNLFDTDFDGESLFSGGSGRWEALEARNATRGVPGGEVSWHSTLMRIQTATNVIRPYGSTGTENSSNAGSGLPSRRLRNRSDDGNLAEANCSLQTSTSVETSERGAPAGAVAIPVGRI
eukprot:CAMPEP_0206430676 /NCGR_PEP_ID=MMETSP0324_2-20121206/6947_1 /ASSEMBLY_ACC=CAM_ASM_000836 /TAXON_ID=2866 /ORGANISM="Crypthecodinium cohnii, Strain Seligo" /LENGTH=526 /DNA_ID=CAMNT_0053896531 /DNA_START=24 /DNA_END=1604 /DNA_ORIENTATION=+